MSLTRQIAAHALGRRDEVLPDDVLHLAKRTVLDSLACIVGAYGSESAEAVLAALPNIDSGNDVSLFGTEKRSGIAGATLYNGALLRYLDLNDCASSVLRPGPGAHNDEMFAPILATAEARNKSGYDVLRALSLGYDVAAAYTDAIPGRTLVNRGWMSDTRATFVMPVLFGFLMDMDEDRLVDAMGIAISRPGPLGIMDVGSEENTLSKNIRFPLGAYISLIAIHLAQAGLTGPENVMEGEAGFIEAICGGEFIPERLGEEFRTNRLREVVLKEYASCYGTHGHLAATIALAKEYDLHLEDVAKVHIRTTTRTKHHNGLAERQMAPPNKETADHSSYWLTAIAIADRVIGPAQYTEERYRDPEVNRVLMATTIEGTPEFDDKYPGAEVTIELRDGSVITKTVINPPGDLKNQLTDAEIEGKFRTCAEGRLKEEKVEKTIEAVWRIDRMQSVRELTHILCGGQ